MKNYIGISRDHSGSMRSIAHVAGRDYNTKIESIRDATLSNGQDTIVSVVECGAGSGSGIKRVVVNSNVNTLKPIANYIANGSGTPLFDSVGDLITQFESVPDAKDPNVSFLVMAITDGHENASRTWSASTLSAKIRTLIATDRWTFVFRVPRGHARHLERLGIPAGNILEWDQTERGVLAAAQTDKEAFTEYFKGRTLGKTSTSKFYTDLSTASVTEVKAALEDISAKVKVLPVFTDRIEIKPFVEGALGTDMKKGASFYQLTKTEPVVQDYKKILIRDKKTHSVYHGTAARQMLGLPGFGNIRLAPGNHGQFEIFIQSTSLNRKLASGTNLIYWDEAAI